MSITFKTGRSRTVTITWALGGDCHIEYFGLVSEPPNDSQLLHQALPTFVCGFFGFTLTGYISGGGYGDPYDEKDLSFAFTRIQNTWNGADTGLQPGPAYDFTFLPNAYTTFDIPVSGAASVSLTVEEWCIVDPLDPSLGTVIDGTLFPAFGGSAQGDGLPGYQVSFVEKAPAGCIATATVTCGGSTASQTAPVPAGTVLTYPAYAYVKADGVRMTASFSNQPSFDGHPLGQAYNPSDSKHSVDGAYGRATASGPDVSSGGYEAITELSSSLSYPVQFGFRGILRSFADPFPAALNAIWQVKAAPTLVSLSPDGASDQDQFDYELVATFDGTTQPGIALHEQGRTYASLGSVAGTGDDPRDWRMQARGTSWNALTVDHAPQTVIPADTARWTAGPHTTKGGTTFSASGGAGSATLAVDASMRVWEGYRYLRLNLTGSTSFNISVSIGGFGWNAAVPAVAADQTLDLCCIPAEGLAMEPADSRYPLKPPGGSPTATDPQFVHKMGWGVNFADSVVLGGIPDGASVTVNSVMLIRQDKARLTGLLTFQNPPLGWTSPTDNTSVWPFATFEADGKGAYEAPAMARVVPTTGGLASFRYFSVADLTGFLTYVPGISATPLTPPADGFHGPSQEAEHLMGGGATYDFGPGQWTLWVDQDIGSTQTLPVQDLWDSVTAYPGAGEVFRSGSYDVRTILPFAKFLRGASRGLVFTPAGVPLAGQTVTTYDDADTGHGDGTGTSDALGRYATGTPYGRGSRAVWTELLTTGTRPHEKTTFANRWRQRTSFQAAPSTVFGCWIGQNALGGIHDATVMSDGTVSARGTAADRPPFLWLQSWGSTVAECHFDYESHGLGAILYAVTDPTGVNLAQSHDEGMTVGPFILTLPRTMHGDVCTNPLGVTLLSGSSYVSGTSGPVNIQVKAMLADGSSAGPTLVSASGSAVAFVDGSFHITASQDGRWMLSAIKDGDSFPTLFLSSDDGQSWTAS